MSAITGIEWTDSTWNPIRGCTRVSEGCRNCYAEKVAYRFSNPGQPYEGLAVLKNGHASWTGAIQFVEKHLLDPLKWRKPRRIFVNSMSDLFHENVTDEMRDKIFAVMALCPQHIFQVLTKRPERMLAYFSQAPFNGFTGGRSASIIDVLNSFEDRGVIRSKFEALGRIVEWPLPNVWMGVSVENQAAADERIPLLLQTPAAVRFLSCEPLLGPITFRPRCDSLADKLHAMEHGYASKPMELIGIDWVICGGESGPHARPMHPDWARSLRDQCAAADVPFFFKQWGEWGHGSDFREDAEIVLNDGRRVLSIFHAEMMAPVGKKAAGALLDGVEHKAFPVRTAAFADGLPTAEDLDRVAEEQRIAAATSSGVL